MSTAEEREAAMRELTEILKEGMTIHVVLKYLSRTNRRVSLFVSHKNEVWLLDHLLDEAQIFHHKLSKNGPNGIDTWSSADSLVRTLGHIFFKNGKAFKVNEVN